MKKKKKPWWCGRLANGSDVPSLTDTQYLLSVTADSKQAFNSRMMGKQMGIKDDHSYWLWQSQQQYNTDKCPIFIFIFLLRVMVISRISYSTSHQLIITGFPGAARAVRLSCFPTLSAKPLDPSTGRLLWQSASPPQRPVDTTLAKTSTPQRLPLLPEPLMH